MAITHYEHHTNAILNMFSTLNIFWSIGAVMHFIQVCQTLLEVITYIKYYRLL